ncbi:MAG: heme ABC exporter ATP-binding protein CcmA [Rhodobacterales bacterium]
MLLTVDNLACRRGDLHVLTGLSLGLAAGRVLVLRGPNGSGKTTLLRTLAGLTPPVGGTITADTEAITYSGHADGLKAQLNVAENLEFWASVFGTLGIDAALAAFDLLGLRDRQAQNLSAGQKRRLGLARLLVSGRKIWLLDEPTVSLDAQNVQVFAGVIKSHLMTGGGAIIATHIDLGLADADVLDISPFRAKSTDHNNPFLDEALA